jgi:hypothetical protein
VARFKKVFTVLDALNKSNKNTRGESLPWITRTRVKTRLGTVNVLVISRGKRRALDSDQLSIQSAKVKYRYQSIYSKLSTKRAKVKEGNRRMSRMRSKINWLWHV